jgi:hypothetical protein
VVRSQKKNHTSSLGKNQGESTVLIRNPPSEEAWCAMRITKTLWPPQHGTKRLKRHYGAQLVCVRYRHDRRMRHRYTTVELLIDHGPMKSVRRVAISPPAVLQRKRR